jgi:hypothetical protein
MKNIIGVHGIRNYHYFTSNAQSVELATAAISDDWSMWLSAAEADVRVAYYSHLLHTGTAQGHAEDVATLTPTAQAIFIALVDELLDQPVLAHGERTARARAMAEWLSEHFGAATRRAALALCREVDTYLSDEHRRASVRELVAAAVRQHQPSIVLAHSLGSVVAYETLWSFPDPVVDLLITIGSPLALRGVVYERLAPGRNGRPPGVKRWINVADVGDIVAIPRGGLRPHFAGVEADLDVVIDKNGFHAIEHYLRCSDLRTLVTG